MRDYGEAWFIGSEYHRREMRSRRHAPVHPSPIAWILVAALAGACDRPAPAIQQWPTPLAEPSAWPPGESAVALIESRWAGASTHRLGSDYDHATIRSLVLTHLGSRDKAKIEEIRWISSDEVMVKASWYTGPLASGSYCYVLQRKAKYFFIACRYLEQIS